MPRPVDPLRNQIIAAALGLFPEKGYHSTLLQDIIAAAQCSKGGSYHHFAGKEDLLCLIHNSFTSYELEHGEAARSQSLPVAERLRRILWTWWRALPCIGPT